MAVLPNPGDRLRGDRTTYTIEEILNKGDSSIACRARDGGGTTVFLKFYKTPSKFKPWFRPYLEYEKELNKRLQTDPELLQKSVYATDVFVGKLERDGSSVGGETQIQVFPFISGQTTLDELMASGVDGKPLDWANRLLVATVTLAAMRALHKAGIVHSDLKPKNFQVAKEKTLRGELYRPLIVDMDFSVLEDRQAPWHDDPNQGYVGSPGYFSPEHLTGAIPLPASDVFTMSEILCELLCGKHPFESVFGEKEEYEKRVLSGETDFGSGPITFLNGKQEPGLEAVLRESLSPDPTKRPTMEALHKAVANVLNETRTKSTPTKTRRITIPPESRLTPPKPRTILKSASSPVSATASGHQLSLTGEEGTVSYNVGTRVSRPSIKKICGEAEARFASHATQFVLETDGTNWFASPGESSCKTLRNGTPLVERTRLSDGDELAIDVPRRSGGSEPHAKMKVAIA